MTQSFIHKSDNNNFYLYDDHRMLSMLVHPEFEKVCKSSTDIDPYYIEKYAYLKNYGFFAKPKLANLETVIDESTVKESIIQTQQIIFEVTDLCNLNCTYCVFGELYEEFDAKNQKHINTRNSITLLKYIFNQRPLKKNRKLGISFYGGEPLLNIRFIKRIVEVANQLNSEKEIDISFSITTNATLIHQHIHFLVKNNIRLLISLDGNEENQSYRVFSDSKKNSFQKVIENIDMIKRCYPKYFDSNVNFNAVLHNRNSVKEIYDFIFTRYHKIPRIAELALANVKSDKKALFKRMFHNKRKSEDEYQNEESSLLHHDDLLLYKELTDFLKYNSINFYISNIIALLIDVDKYWPTNTCIPFSKRIFFTNRNKLLPCERINRKYTMGYVDEDVIIDIPEITQKLNFYYECLKKVCQYCYAYKYCGICMFSNINNLDKLDVEGFVCEYFNDKNTFENKLNRIFSFLEKYPNDFFQILENVVFT